MKRCRRARIVTSIGSSTVPQALAGFVTTTSAAIAITEHLGDVEHRRRHRCGGGHGVTSRLGLALLL